MLEVGAAGGRPGYPRPLVGYGAGLARPQRQSSKSESKERKIASGCWRGGRRWRLVGHVQTAVLIGLLGQPQIQLRKLQQLLAYGCMLFIAGLRRECCSLDAVFISRGHDKRTFTETLNSRSCPAFRHHRNVLANR